jgi:hypothetical protein
MTSIEAKYREARLLVVASCYMITVIGIVILLA